MGGLGCVGNKTALLQILVVCRLVRFANVLFCALAVLFSFSVFKWQIVCCVAFLHLAVTVDGMVSCGITKRKPISLQRPILRAINARIPLNPACTIPCVCALHEQCTHHRRSVKMSNLQILLKIPIVRGCFFFPEGESPLCAGSCPKH